MTWGGRKIARLRALVYSTYPARCRLCHQPIDTRLPATHPMGPSIGHVVPRKRGGTDAITNLRPEHLDCNVRLGARDVPARPSRFDAAFFPMADTTEAPRASFSPPDSQKKPRQISKNPRKQPRR